jgi:uncharacterized membrane protein YjgN (DUF898 family)
MFRSLYWDFVHFFRDLDFETVIIAIAFITVILALLLAGTALAAKIAKKLKKSDPKPDDSYFDGGILSYFGWLILGFLVTTLSLGICFPWALCMSYRWITKHTIIKGRRLKFTGTAIGLFGHWILWLFLSLITLGIYSWWLSIALEKWKVSHTAFEDEFVNGKLAENAAPSYFDGGLLSLIGWKIAGFFLTVLTLGIGLPWAVRMIYEWKIKHTVINGRRLFFNGRGINLLGYWLLWIALAYLTTGLYLLIVPVMLEKWKVKNTA